MTASDADLPAPPSRTLPNLAAVGDGTGRLEPLGVPLRGFGAILRRHLLIVIAIFMVGLGGTAFVVSGMPKEYTSEATILIEPQRTQVSDLQAISPDPGDVASLMRTQIDVLRSPDLARGTVKALRLTENAEFAPHGQGKLSRLKGLLNAALGIATPPPTAPSHDEQIELAANILSSKISFANEARSSVLRVAVTTGDRELSAAIANEIAKQFLDFKRQEKFAAMQRAHDWFEDQLASLGEQLRLADLAVAKFRREHRLDEAAPTDGTGPPSPTINRQQLEGVAQQLALVQRDRTLKEAQLADAQQVLRGERPANSLPAVLVSPLIGQLMGQISTVSGQEAQLATSQGAGNPELVAVRGQLQKLQGRLGQEMAHIVGGLQSEANAVRGQEQRLRQQLESLRGDVSTENAAQVDLQAFQTKARATRSIYESFLTRATQLANVAGIQEPDASLVASARPPLGPSAPKSSRLMAVAGLLSLVLGIAIAIAIERLRGGFSRAEQAESVVGLPVLAAVPELPRRAMLSRTNRIKMARAMLEPANVPIIARRKLRRPSAAEMDLSAALDKLRGQLRARGNGYPKLLMITSALPQEGKSLLAAELARNAAGAGLRVLLVECDLSRPSLGGQFALPAGPGLGEMLSGDLLGDVAAVVQQVALGLSLITAGTFAGDPQELLASPRMAALLAAMRVHYDLIILDTPPVLPVTDALLLSRCVDATLMAVRWEATARDAVVDAVRLLQASQMPLAGVVMTRVDVRTAARAGGRMSYGLRHSTSYLVARLARGSA